MNRTSSTKGKGELQDRKKRQRYWLVKEKPTPQPQQSTIRRDHKGMEFLPEEKGIQVTHQAL